MATSKGIEDPEVYTMHKPCPYCKAAPLEPCVGAKVEKSGRSHTAREDKGNKHRNKDIRNAPWESDRADGVNYSTILPAN